MYVYQIFMEHNIKKILRFFDIHQSIKQEQTGSPSEFAARFYISRRTLYRILETFNDHGILVKFSRKHNTFYFDKDSEDKIKQLLPRDFQKTIQSFFKSP